MPRKGTAIVSTGTCPRPQVPKTANTFKGPLSRRALALAAAVLLLPLDACQSLAGNPSPAQIRIVDASPDAPPLDVYGTAGGALAYNLHLGTITSYVAVPPGSYSIPASSAGTRQRLVSAQGTFLQGSQYTIVVGNYTNTLQEFILKDQTEPAPAGQAGLRFVHQSTRAGALDLYLVPAGSSILNARPLRTDLAFNANTGYLDVPAGTYTLVAFPSGALPTAVPSSYTGPVIDYSSGSARTIVLIDQPSATAASVQAIVANDFDPNAHVG